MSIFTADEAIARAEALSREFARSAAEVDRNGAFPFANFSALREAELLSLTVSKAHGGQGMGLAAICRIIQAIGGGEPSTALVLAMHYIYHAYPALSGRWKGPVHDAMCQASLDGIALVNVMRVEPELGTPTRGGMPATTARRTAGGFRITGHKLYATGSPLLEYFVTWAKTDDPEPLVGWFMVQRGAAGLRIEETWDHMGMRATGSHDLILDEVTIPLENALDIRPPAGWLPPDPENGAWNNLVLAALYIGVARAAQAWLTGYLHERKPSNLGASLATLPRFQAAMGEIETLLWSAERLVSTLAAEADTNGHSANNTYQTSLAKSVAANNAIRAVDIALALIGNPALMRAHPLERHHRDVLCSRIHMPQDDMVQLMAGRAALG
jgi:alkylation response protein AidB-like acyl-CoA dehydrogenase